MQRTDRALHGPHPDDHTGRPARDFAAPRGRFHAKLASLARPVPAASGTNELTEAVASPGERDTLDGVIAILAATTAPAAPR